MRLDGLSGLQAPIAVCNEDHRFMLAEQLWEIGKKPSAIILEPMGKNTAPAVAMAALSAASEDDVLLILPADHVVADRAAFHVAVDQARRLAEQDWLVTFGIVATAPETGYGYIKAGSQSLGNGFDVAAFVEKPDLAKAQNYIESGDYFWNSGMFAFKAGVFLRELAAFNPTMLQICKQALAAAKVDVDFVRLDKTIFSTCPADSIDYAVMEKTSKAAIIPLAAGWNDVGSWSALWDVTGKDDSGNALKGDVLTVDTRNSYIHASSKLVAVIGVQDLVVVETDDAVMVASKDKVQDVKLIVDRLKAAKRDEAQAHRKVYRPWGHYDLVDCGDRHHTKRIVVKPGAKLSVQKHHHRSEHWVVVKGTAMVTKDGDSILVTENESVYIPVGAIHSLKNPGVIPLEMVEVQSGSYLGEDDIVRFEDQYGRV
ncbi:MAG: mannose-1-phosphate guanylyltransferase/mannose-6-phosphate isomerase [Methylomonas sp.]|nr:MAG: mannose-1-phosphate guanylyltransferase/mannose-6-phosphate isomerase [Methylomonas sp.]PPD30831.1 MAG: mannose-1-phosphate guanylyltransferase/mannose-6-phosphate isomerase [Methylomonas sp.]